MSISRKFSTQLGGARRLLHTAQVSLVSKLCLGTREGGSSASRIGSRASGVRVPKQSLGTGKRSESNRYRSLDLVASPPRYVSFLKTSIVKSIIHG
uniref:Uncharacterized protein n=1 Tax=Candidatus Kentrum sp. DK TaxID=2126562 RepID=A0A450RZE3_9GAMM|nr:MAG: hypothetical protein BECKDK2373C_GA0170839_10097 [Candidatus Kentron sp. DK]